jgi:hypothetical protein
MSPRGEALECKGLAIKRAVIHIGMPKTGTTAIQRTLFSVRSKLLADKQILYPSIAANHSVPLGTIFRDKASLTLQFQEPDTMNEKFFARTQEKFRASLEADLADPNWHTLVISGEGLSFFNSKVFARFIEWLTKYVSDISVIAYVRHPVDWTRSMVQQRLKVRGETLAQIYEDMPLPNWRWHITPWLDAVGLERFRLVSFDDALEHDGLIASFCDAAGLPHETILSLDPPPVFANESMSLEAALLLDSLNRQRPLYIDGKLSPERRRYGRGYGIGAIRSVPGNRFCLSAEHAAKARVDSRPDLEWLNATFGTNLFPDIFEDAPIETPICPNTMPQATVDALAIMLSNLEAEQERARAERQRERAERQRERAKRQQERADRLKTGLQAHRSPWRRFLRWLSPYGVGQNH